MNGSRRAIPAVAAVIGCAALAPAALASHPQAAADISRLDYSPIGFYKPGDPVPAPDEFPETVRDGDAGNGELTGLWFNPSGKWNAFDTNVFETLALPYRAPGDARDDDPYGNGGDPRHGFCVEDYDDVQRNGDLAPFAGECPNHQLEYSRYFEAAMREILGDFGVSVRRYPFEVVDPPSTNTQEGTAINTAAIVPGAGHPDERVIVSGHFDQTDDGPASAWDSAEGHAQVIRVAKLMADYWRSTGTRPTATVIFVPWDAEESGTLGSLDYVANNLVPGEEHKVRGYFNTDPCAGGYPAFRNGVPPNRIPLGIQVANPARFDDPATLAASNPPAASHERMRRFNERAHVWLEQVLTHLDDTLDVGPGKVEIFVSRSEASAIRPSDIDNGVAIDDSRDILFSSDWANFEDVGIPFLNPGPAITGPSTQLDPNTPEAVVVLHSPLDNLQTVNALTSTDASGDTFAEGWMKGMELCSHLLAWPMLQPEQGGAQPADREPVAYFEALPNEASVGAPVSFDADGSYQYSNPAARTLVNERRLRYSWDFGDGTTATGKRVEHTYAAPGVYEARLTLRGRGGRSHDTMVVPITVLGEPIVSIGGPALQPLPALDDDGAYTLQWGAPPRTEGLTGFSIEEASDLAIVLAEDAEEGPAGRWEVSDTGDPRIQPWQPSDSSTQKLRGNQRRSGERSFWTGVSPRDFPRVPGENRSILTLRDPIDVGPRGLELRFWSLFQNEGDDQGRVEVAIVPDEPGGRLEWQAVDVTQARLTGAADPHDPAICSPRDPETLTDTFQLRRVPLDRLEGKRILVRFVYSLGADNRLLSQPCGWYVDDVQLVGGSFAEIGTTAPDARSFGVEGRAPGDYAYRVRALYGEERSGPSNVEGTTVTGAGG